jgi:hypothetical protein
MTGNDRRGRERKKGKTTVSVSPQLSESIDSLVGRFGRTKAEVVAAGIECLRAKLQPLSTEVPT